MLRQCDAGARRKLVQFLLQDPAPLLYHDEPVWAGGRMVGRTTSGAYGHALGGAVALGYVPSDVLAGAASYEIEIAGRRFAAAASLAPLYDPKNLRIRA